MNLRLKFETARSTSLLSSDIIARIQLELTAKNYTIKSATDKSIKFKDNPWRPHWRGEPYKLDKAEFAISDVHDNERRLTLAYNWMCYPYILWAVGVATIIILNQVYIGLLILGGVLAIILLVDFLRCQWAADELLEAILKT